MTTSITVPSSMKALVKAKREPGLWLENVPVPPIGPNDLLIRVKKAAICGTDKHIYDWDHWAQATIPVPMAVGHEFMGDVVRIGTAVAGFEIDDRVSGEGHITCGHCRRCRAGTRHLCRNAQGLGVNRPGCFADYVSLPAVNAFKLPAKLSDEVASFLDPLGNAVHTALAFSVVGEDVLITGAGPIGCMAAAVCRHVGARHIVVTDLNPYRLSIASKMGADRVVSPEDEDLDDVMRELGMKEGFDVGLEMSGSAPALRSMLEVTNHGAKMALLGIPPRRDLHRLDQGRLQGPDAQGHLRSRDVRYLVQDGVSSRIRPRRHARADSQGRRRALRRRVPPHAGRRLREDHSQLGVVSLAHGRTLTF